MTLRNLLSRLTAGGGPLALSALAIGGVFRIVAFVRGAVIASYFGLSSLTDAYSSVRQFPLMVGQVSPAQIVWCSALKQGCALLMSIRDCFQQPEMHLPDNSMAGAQEA